MAERLLVTKVKRTGPTQAELYGARHRFPDLKLFDLGELAAVGIDAAALPVGEEYPARFYALYELSDKLNKAGRPYKDILTLQAIDAPATAGSMDNSAILEELRRITAHLAALAAAQGLQVREPDSEADPEPAEDEPRPAGIPVKDRGPGRAQEAYMRIRSALNTWEATQRRKGREDRITGKATPKQAQLVASLFSETFAPDPGAIRLYHEALRWLWDVDSAKDLTFGRAYVTLDWLCDHKDGDTGAYMLSGAAITDAAAMLKAAQEEAAHA